MGDLIRQPHSEINALIEYFDAIGVRPQSVKNLRTAPLDASSRVRVAKVLNNDQMAWAGLHLAEAFEELGVQPAYLANAQANPKMMQNLKAVLLGHASLQVIKHLIDCDAAPFVPDGWKVEEHQKGGQFDWSHAAVRLYLDEGQQDGNYLKGDTLRKRLANRPVLNANVLDYLLANPHLIPEEWKGKYVFFWSTVYRYSDDRLCVRYLYWRDGRWFWHCYWLGLDWSGLDPAALRAS